MPSGRTQLVVNNLITISAGNLASKAAVITNTKVDTNRLQGARISKVKGACHWRSKTDGDGPVIVGISAGLSATEVAAFFTADPQKIDDPGSAETANRRVYPIWWIPEAGADQWPTGAASSRIERIINLGVPSWTIIEGEALTWFIFNAGAGSMTTGFDVDIFSIIVTTWERD